jgi:hypothetical protein
MASAFGRVLAAALVLSATACAGFDPQLFIPLDRAGRAVAVSLKERPSLPKFRPLRQSFGAAINDVRPRLQTSRERTLFGDYEVIDQRLSEMLAVWEELEERDESLLPVSETLASQLQTRYGLPVNTNEPASIYANEALYALRDDIIQRVDKAHELLGCQGARAPGCQDAGTTVP